MIIDDLIRFVKDDAKGKVVKDIRAGLGYTSVLLDDGGCGLAYTFRNEMGCCCGILDMAGKLIGRKADEIVDWAKDIDLLRAAMGLATINAILNDPDQDRDKGNVLEAFSLTEADRFGMVGEFRPILNSVESMTDNIFIFEQDETALKDKNVYPAKEMHRYLPDCDVIVITATSIINGTIDEIVTHCKNARQVCLVGLSTPLCPEVFKKYNITLLAGSVVKDAEAILRITSQGGGTMAMRPAVDQVLVKV